MMLDNSLSEPRTRYDWGDHRLQAEIASGQLAPGDRVKINDLAAAWSISPAPLREAVQRLAARGVLTVRPQRGARVPAVSLAEARDLYGLRVQLEPQALHSSVTNADDVLLASVAETHAEMRALITRAMKSRATSFDAYRMHRAFHDATMARCTSPWLLQLVGLLMDQSMRYVQFTFPRRAPRTHDHDQLLELVLARDADGASAVLADHLTGSLEYLEAGLGERGIN